MKLASRMEKLGTETAFEVLAKAKILERDGRNIIHLEIGEPDFDTPQNIVRAGKLALDQGHTHYGPSPGLLEVREQIAKEVSESRNVGVTAENIVITPGGKPVMFFTILALVNTGDEVLYPNPGFPIYESMIKFVGATPVPIKLMASRDFKIDLDEVLKSITPKTKLIILNSPNNPCGSVISREDLQSLANIAIEKNIVVLSDEIYRKFLYSGEHTSIASFPSMLERTIILDGFSKSYAMTGWRIGYGVFPSELVEPISRLSTNSVSCTASFTQIASMEALTGPQSSVSQMVEEFRKRRDTIVKGLNQIPGIRCPMPEGAFYVFPSVEMTGMSSKEFAEGILQEEGVACLAGESFGEYGAGCIRFSFANSIENIEQALERIKRFLKTRL